MSRIAALAAAVVTVAAVACAPAPAPAPAGPVAGWTPLPSPDPGARVLVLAPFGDGLLALGSVPGPDGRAPAAWTTRDATAWHRLATRSATPYGAQAELVMAGVDGTRVAAYGQAFGGAHSNPRPTLWAGGPDALTEHEQPYTLLGGEDAIATDAETAHAGTFLLAGAWDGTSGRYGAAVWTSPDGAVWSRDADAPGLASEPGEQTFARGATAGPAGFLVVGSTLAAGARTVPLAWTSADGRAWRRVALPSAGPATAAAAACDPAGCVAVGSTATAEQHLVCWTLTGGADPGARRDGPGHGLVEPAQALLAGDRTYVVDAVDHVARLDVADRACATWSQVPLPVASATAAIGPLGSRLVLAAADGLWSRPLGR